MTLFKIAAIESEHSPVDWKVAPRHKIPYITLENGDLIGDTTFIKAYLEKEYSVDFSGGYDDKTLSLGWAIERLCEDHLYWIEVCTRWGISENFDKGPRHFFDAAPEAIRDKIINDAIENSKQNRIAQGIGRFTEDELLVLAQKDIDALSKILGDNQFILGDKICGFDAMVHSILWSVSNNFFKSKPAEYLRTKTNLMEYVKRINNLYYQEYCN